MKKKILEILPLLLFVVSMCSSLFGNAQAHFDSFIYKGEDDYFRKNPLPGANYFYNPILPGWNSYPSICTNGEEDYFLVTSTCCYFSGVPIFHSRDLVNWKQIGHVLDRPSQLKN